MVSLGHNELIAAVYFSTVHTEIYACSSITFPWPFEDFFFKELKQDLASEKWGKCHVYSDQFMTNLWIKHMEGMKSIW